MTKLKFVLSGGLTVGDLVKDDENNLEISEPNKASLKASTVILTVQASGERLPFPVNYLKSLNGIDIPDETGLNRNKRTGYWFFNLNQGSPEDLADA